MLLKQLRKQNEKGFTIIEVLIVLAIAALILLIVFLAVPALQRSARNTSRHTDADSILAGMNEFYGNNGATYPLSAQLSGSTLELCGLQTGSGTPTTSCAGTTTANTNVNIGYYKTAQTSASWASGENNGQINIEYDPASLPSGNISDDAVIIEYAVCSNATTATTSGATGRNVVVDYGLETSAGYTWTCIQAS